MPLSEEDSKKFHDAAVAAKADFDKMVAGMTPEQIVAVTAITEWWHRHYMNAGYKRLGYILNGKFQG